MSMLSAILAGFRRGNARRSAAHTLRGLSAAQLADIGIHPDAIDDVVSAMLANSAGAKATPRLGVVPVARPSAPVVPARLRAKPLAA